VNRSDEEIRLMELEEVARSFGVKLKALKLLLQHGFGNSRQTV
jgi:hypothetical protein